MTQLDIKPLTQAAFAAFGQVLQTDGADHYPINEGTTTRFHNLGTPQLDPNGSAIFSIFRGTKRPFPFTVTMMERHPFGSQAFMPLSNHDWLIVVAEHPDAAALQCFRASGHQGVQYAANVWHHPLLVLQEKQDFFIVDRDGPGINLEEIQLDISATIHLT